MKVIQLLIYNIPLCEVSESPLNISDNRANIDLAKQQYPLEMRYYKMSQSGIIYPIELFLDALDREDIISMAKIQESDSLFDKLYKLAGIKFKDINGFNIRQK